MNTINFPIKSLTKKSKVYFFIIFIFLHFHLQSFATWSIIIIDSETGEIGIAGASCTHNCYGIGKIIPNVGAVIVQAMSNRQAREKGVEMIIAESTPEQVIEALKNPIYDPERQQYAVVTIKNIHAPSTYTGNLTNTFHGALTANGVSVQGNTLANESTIKTILAVILQGQQDKLNIHQILMMALEAGSKLGGDKRCGEQTASTAFITVNKPNQKKPYLNLIIFGQKKGGQNAVVLLRKRYERWKKKHNTDS
jgi:uncharacterized Ntn-hydrolase superfamily protein